MKTAATRTIEGMSPSRSDMSQLEGCDVSQLERRDVSQLDLLTQLSSDCVLACSDLT